MNEVNLNLFEIKKMNKNSLLLENKATGVPVLIHRRIFNMAMMNPKTPLFLVNREWEGHSMLWIATLSTL